MQAGQKEVLISKMPGFLDGITTSSTGTFWVASCGAQDGPCQISLKQVSLTILLSHPGDESACLELPSCFAQGYLMDKL